MSFFGQAQWSISRLRPKRERRRVQIGLINNMGDQALEATERQFKTLIATASDNQNISFRTFALKATRRSARAQDYIAAHYEPARAILGSGLTGSFSQVRSLGPTVSTMSRTGRSWLN